jgi:DNA-directed RNA polymerase specialized sigma24 family protein
MTRSPLAPTSPADDSANLAERIRGPLRGFVFALLADADQADEIVDEVVGQAHTAARIGALGAGGGREAARSWIFQRAYRRVVAIRASANAGDPMRSTPAAGPDRAYDPVPVADPAAEGTLLRSALMALDPQDVACLLLNVVHGFTPGQITSMLELAPEAVRKRLTYAKRLLRDAYFARHAR